jgi:uncharacterized protein YeaO (DUF488 family)
MLTLKRAYDPPGAGDGKRFLVERLWPRGIKKEALQLDAWLKEVAPSDKLRRWFGHDPAKWEEFRRRYFAELDGNRDAWEIILREARRGRVTLIYSSHDQEHNNAVALKEYLDRLLAKSRPRATDRKPRAAPTASGRAPEDSAGPRRG